MISDSTNKIMYLGNGVSTEFRYPFTITKADDIKLIKISPAGAEIPIIRDYYIEQLTSTVHYPGWPPSQEEPINDRPTPLPDGWKLLIYREVDYVQEVALFEQYPFKTIEAMFDKVTMQVQQIREENRRALKLSITNMDADGVDMTLPTPKALYSFRWDASAKRLELTLDPATVIPVVTALKDEVLEYKNDAQAAAATAAADTAAIITEDMQGYVARAVDANNQAQAAATYTQASALAAAASENAAALSETKAKTSEGNAEYWAEQARIIAKPQTSIMRFTANDQRWSELINDIYKLTLDTVDKDIVVVMRTTSTGFEQVFVGSVAIGTSRIIESLDKFSGYVLCTKGADVNG